LIDRPEDFSVTAPVWKWRAADPTVTAEWYFLTIDAQTAAEIRYAALGQIGGFGSVRVKVQIGTTRWQTSLFPHKESGGFILPLKAAVRKAEGIGVGDSVTVQLQV
jgi:Domain of unknown function (DUF1905)